MGAKPHVLLLCHSRLKHLSQPLTGFALLARSGRIKLSQRCRFWEDHAEPGRRAELEAHMEAVIDGRVRVHYDMHDSGALDERSIEACDFYFKRSYRPDLVPDRLAHKVFPFGLNYGVYPDGFDWLELRRVLRLPAHWKVQVVNALQLASRSLERALGPVYHVPTAAKMHMPPQLDQEPRVLFMTRAWDPAECAEPALREERARLNASRARCIELLRREFGRRFMGGLEPSEFARRNFRAFVLESRALALQQAYLETMRRFPICVATTGLHGSNSWKTAEYVAFSKAIVSEPLNFEAPGGFGAGLNYMEFRTPEQCVEQAARLFQDAERRRALMRRNHEYYLKHLEPAKLVLRTIALARGEEP